MESVAVVLTVGALTQEKKLLAFNRGQKPESVGEEMFAFRGSDNSYIERVFLKERPDNERTRAHRPFAKRLTELVERRSATRKPFVAEILVVELNSGAKLSGRTCDLGVHGCYIDTLNPYPQGTLIRIRVQHGKETVEVKGKVVYRVASLGMGIAFYELTPENQATLEEWLSRTDGEEKVFEASLPAIQVGQPALPQQKEEQIVELIRVLMKKGILSRTEAASLLKKPIE